MSFPEGESFEWSVIELKLPYALSQRLYKLASGRGTSVIHTMNVALSQRKIIEEIRDGKEFIPGTSPEIAGITLGLHKENTRKELDLALDGGLTQEYRIRLHPSFLASIEGRAAVEGFEGVEDYLLDAIYLYDYFFGSVSE